MTIVVVVVYAFITSAIDLFHNGDCLFGIVHTDSSDIVSRNDSCLACKFLDSSNSTEVDFSPYLVGITSQFIFQPLPRLMVVNNDEWFCSITSRAPPSNTIS
jgi:hypothetical protein